MKKLISLCYKYWPTPDQWWPAKKAWDNRMTWIEKRIAQRKKETGL